MRFAIGLLLALSARADVDTYPVKSINLDAAMQPAWYNGYNMYGGALLKGVGEGHAVDGIETSDGGYVVVGSAASSPDDNKLRGFAVKVDTDGKFQWGWTSPKSSDDTSTADELINGVIELPDWAGGGLLMAGVSMEGKTGRRLLTRISLESGKQMWTTKSAFGDAKGSCGAWEMVSVTDDDVILAGLDKLDCGDIPCVETFGFKSGGITYGGSAVVMKLPITAFQDTDAPPTHAQISSLLSSDAAWSVSPAGYETVRSARPVPGELGVVCLLRSPTKEKTALVRLEYGNGVTTWAPGALDGSFGQGTSIAVSDDGNVAMTGLSQTIGRWPQSLDTVARLSLFSGVDGSLKWTRSYTVGGVPELIRHECWGVVAIQKNAGYVIACGTGIEPEQCNSGLPKAVRANCTEGIGDNRPGAIPRDPDTWQAMSVMTDADGTLLWQRVDSYRPHVDPAPLGQNGGSAAEWGTLTSEGGVVLFMDDPAAGSLGIMKLSPQSLASGNGSGKGARVVEVQ